MNTWPWAVLSGGIAHGLFNDPDELKGQRFGADGSIDEVPATARQVHGTAIDG